MINYTTIPVRCGAGPGMLREGKSMADYPSHDDSSERMLDELVWWANTLIPTASACASL